MASKNRYAGLPDVDSAPAVYETPELTDDVSTAPTNTVRTGSPTPSDDGGDERLDRQRIDQDSARRRFEPSLVNAKDVNFSDTVAAGDRQSYRTRSRRRRRRQYDDGSDGSESEEETLSSKIARLKREAEEVRLELARQEEADFKDSVEEQDATDGEVDGMEELDQLIRGLHPPLKAAPEESEERFLQSLDNVQQSKPSTGKPETRKDPPHTSSTVSAIAAFSDRLTALEAALGLTTIDPSNQSASILPTIDMLSTHLSALTTTLTPSTKSIPPSTSTPPQQLNLDALSTRIRALTSEADKLTASRKAALQSLSDLHEARLRYMAHRHYRQADGSSYPNPLQSIQKQESEIHTELFLSEQSSKITALYQILPTITSLQPLLPVVLERLRSLSVIHAGAADARGELDDVVRRQGEIRQEVQRWREAVEKVEGQMEEMKEGMKENVGVVGGMVRGVEERMDALQKGRIK
jgi:nuclear migration protein JNM1